MNIEPPFTISGVAERGKRLGTQIGFPTANLAYSPIEVSLPDGVYIAEAVVDGKSYTAIVNQGHHPTVPAGQPTIEAHMLDYTGGDLYGKAITLYYRKYLRSEKRFATLEALIAQLRADAMAAEAWGTKRDKPPVAKHKDGK